MTGTSGELVTIKLRLRNIIGNVRWAAVRRVRLRQFLRHRAKPAERADDCQDSAGSRWDSRINSVRLNGLMMEGSKRAHEDEDFRKAIAQHLS